MSDKYIVYTASIRGVVMYIGHGKVGREKHIISGTSHVYAANKAHFEGVVVDVAIIKEFSTKEEARVREGELINEYRPSWNKVISARDHLTTSKDRKAYLEKVYRNFSVTNNKQKEFIKMVLSKLDSNLECTLSYSDLRFHMTNPTPQYLSEVTKRALLPLNSVLTCNRIKVGVYKVKWTLQDHPLSKAKGLSSRHGP